MSNSKTSSFDALRVGDIADCFHVTRRTVNDWIIAGCPRGIDKRMSVSLVHKWLMEREAAKLRGGPAAGAAVSKASLQEQKIQADIEYKTAQVEKIREKVIERDLHEAILASRAADTSNNWARIVMKNAVYLAMKPVDELKVLLMRFLCEGTAAMVESEKE